MKYLIYKENERGSVLVIALIILVLLTLIGISVTTTSEIETQIAGNEREYVKEFYVADSAWREGIQWLDTRAAVPALINTTLVTLSETSNPYYLNIRNYGGQGDGSSSLNPSIPDGTLGTAPYDIDYWYELKYLDINSLSGAIVPGSGKNYRKFNFRVTSNADQKREVEVTVSKVFKVGY